MNISTSRLEKLRSCQHLCCSHHHHEMKYLSMVHEKEHRNQKLFFISEDIALSRIRQILGRHCNPSMVKNINKKRNIDGCTYSLQNGIELKSELRALASSSQEKSPCSSRSGSMLTPTEGTVDKARKRISFLLTQMSLS